MRFDFEAHYREYFARRGHKRSSALRLALAAASLGWSR
jgi:hypothetical protein